MIPKIAITSQESIIQFVMWNGKGEEGSRPGMEDGLEGIGRLNLGIVTRKLTGGKEF
jgi:hypothetical protein